MVGQLDHGGVPRRRPEIVVRSRFRRRRGGHLADIELCFRSGGALTGVVPATGDGNSQLVDGEGSYALDGDTITFGPGNGSGLRQPIAMDPGEKYTYLGGSLVPSGQRVYITGEVPFRYTLRIR
jgi:hypothetical protein